MAENKELILIIILVCTSLGAYLFVYGSLSDAWALMRVQNSTNQLNNDASAIERVLPLVEEAKEVIEIYDDGDNFEGSMYNDKSFVDAMEDKVKTSDIRIQCLFNEDEDLLFTSRLGGKPNVEIYTRVKGNEDPVHYKLMDGGLKAYLSIHMENDDRQRAFKEVDCSKVPKRNLKKVTDDLFEDIRQDLSNFKKKEMVR